MELTDEQLRDWKNGWTSVNFLENFISAGWLTERIVQNLEETYREYNEVENRKIRGFWSQLNEGERVKFVAMVEGGIKRSGVTPPPK